MIRHLAVAAVAASAMLVPSAASAAPSASWLIGAGPLAALRQIDEPVAESFFNQPTSYVHGSVPAGWAPSRVTFYESFAAFQAAPAATHWVLYDPEKWDKTPLAEQQDPATYMAQFVALAHARGNQVILTPGMDLVYVDGAVCGNVTGESSAQTYIRCGLAAAGARAGSDVFEVMSQSWQPNPATFAWLIQQAAAQVQAVNPAIPVWAGFTTDRGDPVSEMVACYQAVATLTQGGWLNTSVSTIGTAGQFLKAIQQ